jgi:hypothetical protein
VSLKKAARIGVAAAALSAAVLVVVAGPASASPAGASVPASHHHHKGTDQLDEDGPSYNKPAEPKDEDQEASDITPGGVPVGGSENAVQDAPNKVLPEGADQFIPPSSDGGVSDLGSGGVGK